MCPQKVGANLFWARQNVSVCVCKTKHACRVVVVVACACQNTTSHNLCDNGGYGRKWMCVQIMVVMGNGGGFLRAMAAATTIPMVVVVVVVNGHDTVSTD